MLRFFNVAGVGELGLFLFFINNLVRIFGLDPWLEVVEAELVVWLVDEINIWFELVDGDWHEFLQ